MRLKLIFLTLSIVISQLGVAQVKFETKLSKKKLGINEILLVEFVMNQDGDNFAPPNFRGFRAEGPYQSFKDLWVNRKRTFTKTYTYKLTPTKTGNFTIGQARIEVDGQTYKTQQVKVQVTSAVSKPKDGNDADYVASENLHLVAEVSKANPYLNEAIAVTYKLYAGPEIRISDLRPIDNPKYKDFWSQAIKIGQLKLQQGEYKGLPANYVVYGKTVLYPQKTGKLEIEPLTLSVAVSVPTNRNFGGFVIRDETVVNKTVSAGARTINVKPLPSEGRPADFTGAVGSFDFKVTPSRTSLNATESLETKILVTGNGNLKLFDLPKLTVPNGLEQYEPEHNERVRTNLSGMSGNISDSYTLIPQTKGTYPIPPISFSYFDLKTKTYKTITSNEIVIDAKNGPNGGSAATSSESSATNTAKRAVTQVGSQFRFLKSNANLKSVEKKYFFKSAGYWIALITPLLAIPLFLFFGKKREERLSDVSGNRVRKADKLARKYLSEAKKNLGDQKEFYIAMERALHNYLKAKLHIQTSEMSKDRIERLLKEREVQDSTSIEFIALLESCEFARYTPSSNTAMQQDYDKASRVISAMDKQL